MGLFLKVALSLTKPQQTATRTRTESSPFFLEARDLRVPPAQLYLDFFQSALHLAVGGQHVLQHDRDLAVVLLSLRQLSLEVAHLKGKGARKRGLMLSGYSAVAEARHF